MVIKAAATDSMISLVRMVRFLLDPIRKCSPIIREELALTLICARPLPLQLSQCRTLELPSSVSQVD